MVLMHSLNGSNVSIILARITSDNASMNSNLSDFGSEMNFRRLCMGENREDSSVAMAFGRGGRRAQLLRMPFSESVTDFALISLTTTCKQVFSLQFRKYWWAACFLVNRYQNQCFHSYRIQFHVMSMFLPTNC